MSRERRWWFALVAVSVVATLVFGVTAGVRYALGWSAVALFALVMGLFFVDRR